MEPDEVAPLSLDDGAPHGIEELVVRVAQLLPAPDDIVIKLAQPRSDPLNGRQV